MDFLRKLPVPKDIKEVYPVSEEMKKLKEKRDAELKDIFSGKDGRLVLIVGPCSADNEKSVLVYLEKLKKVAERVNEKIMIMPRVYTNKPRTTGAGYKGMLHQPDPNKTPDMLEGLVKIRDLHMKAVRDIGFTCADEMLYCENYRYLSDLLSYVAVGARSVENQLHRLTSSGLDIPVGMKNPTSGDLSVMMNSIIAAQNSHMFIYRGWEVKTSGNAYAHAILRGYVNKHGQSIANYHYEDLINLCNLFSMHEYRNPSLIVDANHCNSGKKYEQQPRIVKEVLHSAKHSDDIRKILKGFMIESYIEDGSCKPSDNIFGKSITDPCLGWEKTERLIYEIADEL